MAIYYIDQPVDIASLINENSFVFGSESTPEIWNVLVAFVAMDDYGRYCLVIETSDVIDYACLDIFDLSAPGTSVYDYDIDGESYPEDFRVIEFLIRNYGSRNKPNLEMGEAKVDDYIPVHLVKNSYLKEFLIRYNRLRLELPAEYTSIYLRVIFWDRSISIILTLVDHLGENVGADCYNLEYLSPLFHDVMNIVNFAEIEVKENN